MKGLTNKDKELLDYLFDYCRYTTKQLAKALNLPQQTVSYRIKRLEDRNYIKRYDAVLNWDVIPLEKVIYLFKTNNPEEIAKKVKDIPCVHSVLTNTSTYNLSIFCFFKDKEQREDFESKYDFERKIKIDKVVASSSNLFDTEIKLKKPKMQEKQIELDDNDVKIIKHVSTGHARDPILKISKDLNMSYDIVQYRFMKLLKNKYFTRLIPQTEGHFSKLKTTLIVMDFKEVKEETIKRLENLSQLAIGGYNEKTVYLHIISDDYKDYLEKLEEIHKATKREQTNTETMHWKEIHLVNRYPLEYLIEP